MSHVTLPTRPADPLATISADGRWFGAGRSGAEDGFTAGAEATVAAIAGRPEPGLLLVFARDCVDMPSLLDGVRSQCGPNVKIAGCSTIEPMAASADPATFSVSVVAFGGGFGYEIDVAREVEGTERAAGKLAAAGLARLSQPNKVLVLLIDPALDDNVEIVRGAYSTAGAAVPLVGGLASDDWKFDRTCQFAGDSNGVQVLHNAVVGIAIGSPQPVGLGIAHGWRRAGDPMVVTDSSGLKVYEFDNEPALDVFLARVGLDESALTGSDSFRLAALEYPLGVATRSGEEIRVIQGVDLADRSVWCSADIPQGGLAWLMEGDPDSLVAGGAESCQQAVRTLGGATPIGLLTFDCAVRRRELGPAGVRREFAEIERIFPGVPFGGFYSYGEIARYRGATGMHHLTMVCLALA
ncbi:FIST signal transduction protein [Actinoplanes sp. L3-i22]|uniref:FIST signal transduction protein n=1 Tax=Actinoplanes sp. L3-i22 TaxID=2836373 RepID=UPI001C852236|nr:FIST N-terminal domain-containing protein [Actinoplanes sp. L3-i22]